MPLARPTVPSEDLPPHERRRAARALVEELRERRDVAAHRGTDVSSALSDFARASRHLRQIAHTDELLRAACEEAAAVSRLQRTVISSVEDGRWTVRCRHDSGDTVMVRTGEQDGGSSEDERPSREPTGESLEATSVLLRDGMPEARAVGSAAPVVVATSSEVVLDLPPALGSLVGPPYAIVPLVQAGTVVGLLHGAHADNRRIDDFEVATLNAFAGTLSALWYSSTVEESWARQVQDIHRTMTGRLERLLAEPIDEPDAFELPPGGPGDDAPTGDARAGAALRGRSLTPREKVVLKYVLNGMGNREIAEELVLTVDTVKSHVKRILRKLGAANRSELIHRRSQR